MLGHYQQRLALFKHQPYALYVLACFLINIGGGISYVAMAWLLLNMHSGISSVMWLMVCYWVPNALFSPFAGVLVDRYSRRLVVLLMSAFRGLLWIVFGLVMLHSYHPTLIYVFSFLAAMGWTFAMPASATMMRELVREDQLLFANANLDMAYELGNLIGFGGAGFMIAWLGAVHAIMLNGAFFGVAVIALALMRYQKTAKEIVKASVKQILRELVDGLKYIVANKHIFRVYVAQLLVFVAALTAPILMAPYARVILHATAVQFGQIEASISIGLLVAGLFLPYFAEKFSIERVSIVVSLCGALSFSGFLFEKTVLMAQVLYFIVGFYYATWPLLMAKAQQITEFEFQGRTQSSFGSFSSCFILLIYVLVGVLSHYISLHLLYGLEVLVALLTAVVLL